VLGPCSRGRRGPCRSGRRRVRRVVAVRRALLPTCPLGPGGEKGNGKGERRKDSEKGTLTLSLASKESEKRIGVFELQCLACQQAIPGVIRLCIASRSLARGGPATTVVCLHDLPSPTILFLFILTLLACPPKG